MYWFGWTSRPANHLVTGKSRLIRWQHFHNFFLFFPRLPIAETTGRSRECLSTKNKIHCCGDLSKTSSCQPNKCIHWFTFIACGANFNGWICVCASSPSVLLLHVTHKTTSTIHRHTKLKWWPCIYTCSKISDRSVSVNVILLRALSVFVLFYRNTNFGRWYRNWYVCVSPRLFLTAIRSSNIPANRDTEWECPMSRWHVIACTISIYHSFVHAYRIFQCHLRVISSHFSASW